MFFHKNNPENFFNGLEFMAASEYRWTCWPPAFVGLNWKVNFPSVNGIL